MTQIDPALGSIYKAPESRPAPPNQEQQLREVAQKLEATFLAEMLKSAGMHKTSEAFGGGSGEDQFGTFLIQAQADEMARAGGIGLAEHIFESLKERANESV
ncbi:MAG: rod-binding protein [Paracoccaceae bacterium]